MVDQYVSTTDLLPTLAEAAGIQLKDPTLDGTSLFEQWRQDKGDRLLVWKWGNTWAVRKGGPFNAYIYNNTVYVKEDSRSCFDFATTTDGILIANNIFYILGKTVAIGTNNASSSQQSIQIPNVVFKNNLYEHSSTIPSDLIIQDSDPIIGDPGFQNIGGLNIDDYIPSNKMLVQDKGVEITKIPGDPIGISGWFGSAT